MSRSPHPDSAAPCEPYRPVHHVRLVTAASLFDGHDAAINIMRRLLQATGAEVIHLGHNRSVREIVDCALQEDAQGIAITSYQGGHLEFLKYMHDLIAASGRRILIFAGGGGTILPDEIAELHAYGIARVYSPDDGRSMGLQGMINEVMRKCDFAVGEAPTPAGLAPLLADLSQRDPRALARLITLAENFPDHGDMLLKAVHEAAPAVAMVPVLGITGTGGAGKSSLVDELVRRYLIDRPEGTVAIVSVDPSRRRSGGALLGDRIRMNAIDNPRVFMRSLATRQSNLALSAYVRHAIDICKAAGFGLVIVETSGIGQSDTEIVDHADLSLYVMTAEYGAASQLEKIDMLDFADVIAINKFDHRGSLDALRDVRRQYRRNHNRHDGPDESLPVFATVASQFNDSGVNRLYAELSARLDVIAGRDGSVAPEAGDNPPHPVIPPERVRYLAEIVENSRTQDRRIAAECALASRLYRLHGAIAELRHAGCDPATCDPVVVLPEPTAEAADSPAVRELVDQYRALRDAMSPASRRLLEDWPALVERYRADEFRYEVRGKVIAQPLVSRSLSGTRVPRVCLPRWSDWGDTLRWLLTENVPGCYPYAGGVFPLKREGEDPTRMFAGEGGPERTNRRFHFVSLGMPAIRLSTAFDSVTLYGEDPARRPDIYGKVGNSGVSVATVDDAKKLYSGFDLADAKTSVSMTINGPAPMMLAFFLNAAVDQGCEKYIRENGLVDQVQAKLAAIAKDGGWERPAYAGPLPDGNTGLGLLLLGASGDQVLPRDVYERIKADTLAAVRGTVQADILKEDQAQNTCIFSTEFALRLMGDIQQYFIDHRVRNFYSVSISGYHIAEAGANPITQLALTLANGFTFVEYYLSRGMPIDSFAPNLSFFFSNGMDPEYSVLGRVARRLWARAIRHRYGGNERSQMLKYHIQTSGRSLHAQEIAFNDIRTTLQALYAIYDNCNSLHTNAYDEAITTPTEESVRRAMAIQLIINRELGLARNENPLQGSFIIDELTELVEEAVLAEFAALSERGGVLGAMERMYQRTKIQEESLRYESLKHSGELPIIGVNTYLDPAGSPTVVPREVIRSTESEKEFAIATLAAFQARNAAAAPAALAALQLAAVSQGNTFSAMLEAAKVCSLGQISGALYAVGGQYRRSM